MLIRAMTSVCAQEQKMLFCTQSLSYNKLEGFDSCEFKCDAWNTTPEKCLQKELDAGWKISSTSPITVPKGAGSYISNCVGTQYVLNKLLPPVPVVEKSAENNQELVLLKKEIELLKKELEISKAETATVKSELALLNKNVPVKKKS